MEPRKIIGFGNSSYVISLPKNWITRNKLKKGDTIYLDEKIDDLVLTTSETPKKEERELLINIEGKEIEEIRREITNAYVNNNNTITIIGKNIEKLSQEIRKNVVHDLMALEIVEQSPNKIIAKCFLDMDQINVKDLIRQIDIIIRSIMIDSKSNSRKELYENIMERDKNINRLAYLAFRSIKYMLETPITTKKHKIEYSKLLNYWLLVVDLEEIGDEVKRVARYLVHTKLRKKEEEVLLNVYQNFLDYHLEVMKYFYTENKKEAMKLIKKRDFVLKQIDSFCETYPAIKNVPFIAGKLKNMLFLTHKINKITYT